MDADVITLVSGVVSTAASVGAFVVALVALVRARRNKKAVLDAQVESDFVARVLAKVLRLMSQDARGDEAPVEPKELPAAEVPSADATSRAGEADRRHRYSSAIAELQSAMVEYDNLTSREQRMHDDGPWAGYDVSMSGNEESEDEDPRRR